MFFRRKQKVLAYDRENLRPVIRSSICTGEKAAGFEDMHTGKWVEAMLIHTPEDLAEFRHRYGIQAEEIVTRY